MGQYKQAMRQLPAQLTDVVTQLAGGQNPFLILLQQGGQVRDSFGGVGNALKALGSIITPARIAIGGLAAGVVTLIAAYQQGQKESFEFNKAVILTGDAAGVTAGQLGAMADQISDIVGSQHQAAGVLIQVLGAGSRINGSLVQDVARLALELQKIADIPIKETITEFAALGENPVQAVEALQKQFSFLTTATYQQIVALQKTGQVAEAAEVAQRAFLGAQESRIKELEAHAGALQKLWLGIKGTASSVWSGLLAVGRDNTPEERLRELESKRGTRPIGQAVTLTQIADDVEEQRVRGIVDANKAWADAQAETTRRVNENIAAVKEQEKILDVAAAFQAQVTAASLGAGQATVQRALNAQTEQYRQQESEVQALRSADLISAAEYYDQRRKLVEKDTQAQVEALRAQNDLIAKDSDAKRVAAAAAASRGSSPSEQLKISDALQIDLIANQEKIKSNEGEIALLREKAIGQLRQLGTQQAVENVQLTRSYQDARAAAEEYQKTIERTQRLELAGLGQGQRQRDYEKAKSDIAADFEKQRFDLAGELRRGQIEKPQYDAQLALIDEFQQKALDSYDKYYGALQDKQGSWLLGAQEAFRNYVDEANASASAVADAIKSGLDDATDALTKFVTTGKGSFKDLVNSIIADLVRIELKKGLAGIVSQIAGKSGVGALTGSTAGYAAGGGSMSGPRIVGEDGPELDTGGGNIMNRRQLQFAMAGGGGINYAPVTNINMSTNATDPQQVAALVSVALQQNNRKQADDLNRRLKDTYGRALR